MKGQFTAINYITCRPEFTERFEELFGSRMHAIDKEPGFINVQILRPDNLEEPYLIVSNWESRQSFENWTRSEAFMIGHRRAFQEMAKAKEEGLPAPMTSSFKVYEIIGV